VFVRVQTFHLENLDQRHPPPEARSCYKSDSDKVRAENKERKRMNKMRRKQYEIEVLKQVSLKCSLSCVFNK